MHVGLLESCVLPLSKEPSRVLLRGVCGPLWPMDYLQSAPISKQCGAINSSPIGGAFILYGSCSIHESSASQTRENGQVMSKLEEVEAGQCRAKGRGCLIRMGRAREGRAK